MTTRRYMRGQEYDGRFTADPRAFQRLFDREAANDNGFAPAPRGPNPWNAIFAFVTLFVILFLMGVMLGHY